MLKFNKWMAMLLAFSSNIGLAFSPPVINHLELNASALYLQPGFGGNGLGYSAFGNYAGADNQQVIFTDNGINHIYNIKPRRDWGFQIGAGFYYCRHNDVRLDWYHLKESVNGHFPHGSMFSGSIDGFYAGNLELDTRWDALNLEFGHAMDLWPNVGLRLHAGLAYARIKNTFTNHPKLFLNSDPYFTSHDTISYRGIGPRLGVDFHYGLQHGFNIFAKTAGSLLVGQAKQAISGYRDVVNNIYGVIPFGTNNFVSSNNNVLVPQLEAKLGVSYVYTLAHSHVAVSLGYMWMTYLHSMVAYTGMGVVGSSIGIPSTTHFDLNGVFLNLKWHQD